MIFRYFLFLFQVSIFRVYVDKRQLFFYRHFCLGIISQTGCNESEIFLCRKNKFISFIWLGVYTFIILLNQQFFLRLHLLGRRRKYTSWQVSMYATVLQLPFYPALIRLSPKSKESPRSWNWARERGNVCERKTDFCG